MAKKTWRKIQLTVTVDAHSGVSKREIRRSVKNQLSDFGEGKFWDKDLGPTVRKVSVKVAK